MVDHLSCEGRHAGTRYCGATDGTSCHLPYVADVDAWAAKHVACAACRKILADAIDDGTFYGPATDADVAGDPRA
jgi:hypothetical protein